MKLNVNDEIRVKGNLIAPKYNGGYKPFECNGLKQLRDNKIKSGSSII